MTAEASRYRRLVRARKPRWLLSGALASLAGYVALAVLAAHQQFFALDYGTRTERYSRNILIELITSLNL